jgi:hypothetical protein
VYSALVFVEAVVVLVAVFVEAVVVLVAVFVGDTLVVRVAAEKLL